MALTTRYQMNVAFPTGKDSEKWKALIDKLCKRYGVTPNVVVRIAIKTLDGIPKANASTDV